MSFDIRHTNNSDPSEGKIEVYNLAQETIGLAQQDNAVVRLLAGYQSLGGVALQIFQGNPITGGVKLERRETDRVLVMECQDGGREIITTHVSESFATATTSAQLFAFYADKLGVALGNVDAIVGTISFPFGFGFTGQPKKGLDRLAEISRARWTIRDGVLQVWPLGGSTGESAVVFSSVTGNLVGDPSVTDDGVEIKGLIAPSLRPGKPFQVESNVVNGDYIATDVQFRGDSHQDEFYVIATGEPN